MATFTSGNGHKYETEGSLVIDYYAMKATSSWGSNIYHAAFGGGQVQETESDGRSTGHSLGTYDGQGRIMMNAWDGAILQCKGGQVVRIKDGAVLGTYSGDTEGACAAVILAVSQGDLDVNASVSGISAGGRGDSQSELAALILGLVSFILGFAIPIQTVLSLVIAVGGLVHGMSVGFPVGFFFLPMVSVCAYFAIGWILWLIPKNIRKSKFAAIVRTVLVILSSNSCIYLAMMSSQNWILGLLWLVLSAVSILWTVIYCISKKKSVK